MSYTFDDLIDAEGRAEAKIQRILLDLEEETGHRLDYVRVDTRNFANCAVEVSLEFPRAHLAKEQEGSDVS